MNAIRTITENEIDWNSIYEMQREPFPPLVHTPPLMLILLLLALNGPTYLETGEFENLYIVKIMLAVFAGGLLIAFYYRSRHKCLCALSERGVLLADNKQKHHYYMIPWKVFTGVKIAGTHQLKLDNAYKDQIPERFKHGEYLNLPIMPAFLNLRKQKAIMPFLKRHIPNAQ